MSTNLFIIVLIARLPGSNTEVLGVLFFQLTVAQMLATIGEFGISQFIVVELSKLRNHRKIFISTLFCQLLLFSSAFLIYVVVVFANPNDDLDRNLQLQFGAAIFLSTGMRSFNGYYHHFRDFVAEIYVNLIDFASLLVLASIILMTAGEIEQFIIMFFLARIIGAALCVALFIIRAPLAQTAPQYFSLRKVVTLSAPFGLVSSIAIFYLSIETILLRFLVVPNADAAIAHFQGALRLILITSIVPVVVFRVFLPEALAIYNQSRQEFLKLLSIINSALTTLAISISLIFIFNAQILLKVLYGDKLTAASPVLSILALLIPLRFGVAFNLYMICTSQLRRRLAISVFVVCFSITANLLAIPTLGIWGAVFSIVLSHLISTAIYVGVVRVAEGGFSLAWVSPASIVIFVVYALLAAGFNYLNLPVLTLSVSILFVCVMGAYCARMSVWRVLLKNFN